MADRARAEQRRNRRYRWLGELPHAAALRELMASRCLVQSSRMEGGANAISEAIVCDLPVLSSRVGGSVGLLGDDYPGYFPVGDTLALKELLLRIENEPQFLRTLARAGRRRRKLFTPARERQALAKLLRELRQRVPTR
jgi:glycosyltransferase involved in cell wall biosynthesis